LDFHILRSDGAPNDHPGHTPWRVTDEVGGFASWVDAQEIAWRPDLDGQANGQIRTTGSWLRTFSARRCN
jgi:hypothetical protein